MSFSDDPIASGAASGAALGTTVLPGWGTVIGGVVGAGAGAFQMKEMKKRRISQQRLAKARMSREIGARETAMGHTRAGLKAQTKAYDKAEKRVSSASRTAKRQVLDRQKEIAGQLQARFGGNSQTTAYQNALGGLSSQATRDMADVDAIFSNQLSNLALGRGNAEANARGIMGNIATQQGQVAGRYYETLAGIDQQFRIDPADIYALTTSGAASGLDIGNLLAYGPQED